MRKLPPEKQHELRERWLQKNESGAPHGYQQQPGQQQPAQQMQQAQPRPQKPGP
jgi:hypothetical protein